MGIDKLTAVPTKDGRVELRCPDCNVVPYSGYAARDGKLIHILVCPHCACWLGEWGSTEERNSDLVAFARKALEK
jgi:uncharacterized C2H2 Zn-finger protein